MYYLIITMTICLFITNQPTRIDNSFYNYNDRITKNIFNNNHEIYYSGQKKGKMDNILLKGIKDNDEFKIYYRYKKMESFIELGSTKLVKILSQRKVENGIEANDNEILKLYLIVKNVINKTIPKNNFTGAGKFKKDVAVYNGLMDIDGNELIHHNKNTNNGYYYYKD